MSWKNKRWHKHEILEWKKNFKLIQSGFSSELSQWRNFTWMSVRRQVAELNLFSTSHNVLLSFVAFRPLLVRRSIKDDHRRDVNVPHSVNAGQESRWKFDVNIIAPLPKGVGDLSENESNNCEKCANKSGQHEKFEAINYSFVVQTTHFAHRWENAALDAYVAENLPDHVAQEEEINRCWNRSEENEGNLKKKFLNSKEFNFEFFSLTAILLPNRLTQTE